LFDKAFIASLRARIDDGSTSAHSSEPSSPVKSSHHQVDATTRRIQRTPYTPNTSATPNRMHTLMHLPHIHTPHIHTPPTHPLHLHISNPLHCQYMPYTTNTYHMLPTQFIHQHQRISCITNAAILPPRCRTLTYSAATHSLCSVHLLLFMPPAVPTTTRSVYTPHHVSTHFPRSGDHCHFLCSMRSLGSSDSSHSHDRLLSAAGQVTVGRSSLAGGARVSSDCAC
jgi:hypothetical protein